MTPAVQHQIDFRQDSRVRLARLESAMRDLKRRRDDVLALIENGKLAFAFDVATPGSKHKLPLIWEGSIEWYLQHPFQLDQEHSLEFVIDDILPPRAAIRASELMDAWIVSQEFISGLIEAGAFALDPVRNVNKKAKDSPWVTRESLVRFLTDRRIT